MGDSLLGLRLSLGEDAVWFDTGLLLPVVEGVGGGGTMGMSLREEALMDIEASKCWKVPEGMGK